MCRAEKNPSLANLSYQDKLKYRHVTLQANMPDDYFPDFWLTFLLRGMAAGDDNRSPQLTSGCPLDREDLGCFAVGEARVDSPVARLKSHCSSKQRQKMDKMGMGSGKSDGVKKLEKAQQAALAGRKRDRIDLTEDDDEADLSWNGRGGAGGGGRAGRGGGAGGGGGSVSSLNVKFDHHVPQTKLDALILANEKLEASLEKCVARLPPEAIDKRGELYRQLDEIAVKLAGYALDKVHEIEDSR